MIWPLARNGTWPASAWGGDATVGVTDVGDGRYIVEWGMDLANYSTMQRLIIGGFGVTNAGEPAGPLWSGLDLPGNPYPDDKTCRVERDGEPAAACEVHGRLSADGLLLATLYRPDFSIVLDPMDMPPEVVADEPAWVARLDTLVAEVTVRRARHGHRALPHRAAGADPDHRLRRPIPRYITPLPRRHHRHLR